MPFETKLTPEMLKAIRIRCLEMPELTHEKRAEILAKEFGTFTVNTMRQYSRIGLGCTNKVFDFYMSGKISQGVLSELCTWEKGEQDFIVDEMIEKKLTTVHLERIRRFRKEHAWGFEECIAKATGAVPLYQPRKSEPQRKSLDVLLSEIADKGARWRAMVTQAIEMVGEEEASAGIHEAIFTKVFMLREVLGNQYDFVNNKLNRYMNMIRKRLQNGGQSPEAVEAEKEGGNDAGSSGIVEKAPGVASGPDGQPLQAGDAGEGARP